MKIRNMDEAQAALLPFVPLVGKLTGKTYKLDRITELMELLGNPQEQLRVVHIAGTSGKTSTAYYIAALLQAAGKHVGLTVSPHVDVINERLQFDGVMISDELFCTSLGEFLDIIAQASEQPSYFELLYSFALWMFARQNVDYAVVETGVGGLYDATNVAANPDKVCVITDIAYDHMHILGSTLPEIAAQKIGIVHQHNVVLMYEQSAEIMNVVTDWVTKHQATLVTTSELHEQEYLTGKLVTELPAYQQRNWQLAYKVYRYVAERDMLLTLNKEKLLATQQIQVPGRMDITQVGDKTVVMDGAHNEQKMVTFLDSFKRLYPNQRPAVLFTLKADKQYERVLPLIAAVSDAIIVTTFDTSQDLPARSMDPTVLADELRAVKAKNVRVITDHTQAYQALLKSKPQVLIVTGSFYLLSQIRNNTN